MNIGEYYIAITARDNRSGAQSTANMRLKITPDTPNLPILFDPLTQIKILAVGRWYSIAIGATDEDPEALLLDVTGAAGNALGYAEFKKTEDKAGRIGGTLIMKMDRPGELSVNLCARDKRAGSGYSSNKTIAELHFIVR